MTDNKPKSDAEPTFSIPEFFEFTQTTYVGDHVWTDIIILPRDKVYQPPEE